MKIVDMTFVFDGYALAELVAAVVAQRCFAEGTEKPDDAEWAEIMKNAFAYVGILADRAQMARPEALDDLRALPEVPEPDVTRIPVSEEPRPEFGGIAPTPFGFDPSV